MGKYYIQILSNSQIAANLRREKRRMNRAEGALGLGLRRLLARCLSPFLLFRAPGRPSPVLLYILTLLSSRCNRHIQITFRKLYRPFTFVLEIWNLSLVLDRFLRIWDNFYILFHICVKCRKYVLWLSANVNLVFMGP